MNTMTLLQDAAAWAWHTSLVVAAPALILLALGRWRGFSPRWRMLFAGALLLRLLLPSVPELSWHPASAWQKDAPALVAMTTVSGGDLLPVMESSSANEVSAAPESPAFPWHALLAGVWASGALITGGWLVVSHWFIRRWVLHRAAVVDLHVARLFQWSCERMGIRRRIGLVGMPGIATAAVCGWLRPVVLVPANLRETHTDDEIRGILLHELAHVRRCDVLWSWLGLAACALHWFNPLAWLALRRFHADRELDCDRMALAKLTAPQREAYAPALFKTLEGPAFAAPAALVPFFRHKHEIHTRILTIMKPTTSLLATLAALLVIPALSVFTLTTAKADEEKPTNKPAAPETPVTGKPAEETAVKRSGGERDGETARKGPRDGETPRTGTRDGEGARKTGPRDGEGGKTTGPRDGEGTRKTGVRDGEGQRKSGARDGEQVRRTGERDGEGTKRGARDGERSSDEAAADGKEAVVLRVTGNGESVTVGGETVPTNRLRGFLSEHLAAHRGAPVFIEAEDNVPHKAVMDVLDAAKDNGAKNASIRAISR